MAEKKPANPATGYRDDAWTLRDLFAAAALVGISGVDGMGDYDNYASFAYSFADAMLAEREKRNG